MKNTLKEIKAQKRRDILIGIKDDIIDAIEETRLYKATEEFRYERYKSKCWKCFYKMLTPSSRNRINTIENAIDTITDSIYARTGWWLVQDYEFYYEDGHKNMNDYESRSWNTYKIPRNENGFYVDEDKEYKQDYILRKEQYFFEENKELLAALHILLNERKKFYNGGYKLNDESDREAANKLLIELRVIEKPTEEKELKL